jgi:hypothetical protein
VKAVRNKVKSSRAPRKAKAGNGGNESQALRLAAEIEQGIVDGQPALSRQAQQKLMAALCKSYSQQVQVGEPSRVVSAQSGVSPTDVMITASALLKAVDLQVFELGMWQSWTGR